MYPKLCILLELMNSSLYQTLHEMDSIKFSNAQKMDVAIDICYALNYLHQLEIIHNVSWSFAETRLVHLLFFWLGCDKSKYFIEFKLCKIN